MAQCNVHGIKITQTTTGRRVEGDTEFDVVIRNNCECPQFNVTLGCQGFSTVELVDPKFFKELGNGSCLVNSGHALAPRLPYRFRYAWHTPTALIPKSSTTRCA
ncbi:hypothetical protein BVC80_1837g269 [Macleaya cordata]|uniref:Uncharacterized protein n=1 Tax=Macleaya cordata TaxID=56857 RepID=A0A200R404_MACCD|nr:hypothetical protein BVC80_1837g269 [Macleaya cordata]